MERGRGRPALQGLGKCDQQTGRPPAERNCALWGPRWSGRLESMSKRKGLGSSEEGGAEQGTDAGEKKEWSWELGWETRRTP